MREEAIYQFAITREGNICPVCGKQLIEHRAYTIAVTSPDQKISKKHTCDMLYCGDCDLPFVNIEIGHTVWNTTGCWLSFFVPDEKCSAESIQRQMYHPSKYRVSSSVKRRLEKEKRTARWNERKERLQAIPSAVVMICTKEKRQLREYIITNSEVDSDANNIFDYKSLEGRELLSAAFASERERLTIKSQV